MIVRDESHIIREALDAAAPYISSWVIVDTGSTDGTQGVIRDHMASLGIPGQLHERPWRNFGHNRTEALSLAQGNGDYIWVFDADDTVVGTPDFTQLSADIYMMRRRHGCSAIYWRFELFRGGVRAGWVGVTHEYVAWDDDYVSTRLEGDYHIEDRQLSSRNVSGEKFARDRDLLLAEVERNPADVRSVFYLAQSYYDMADFVNARRWYRQRVDMGGWDEEVFYSMFRVAECMAQLEVPWPEVQDAYLEAWEFRPGRAEPLHAIASRYRNERRYQLGHLYAERAARIPHPEQDTLFARPDIHAWRAADEQAICASWMGEHTEAFTLCRRILARPDLPDDDRKRIAGNRDFSVPAMIESASSSPSTSIAKLTTGSGDKDVTVTLVTGPDATLTERTLNTFFNCCNDAYRVLDFLAIDVALPASKRATLQNRYPFLRFTNVDLASALDVQLRQIRALVQQRFWLHLGHGWQFFAPENYITRLNGVLNAEPRVVQVGVNLGDAEALTGTSAPEDSVRRAPIAGRYVLTNTLASGPAMVDTARFDRCGLGNDRNDDAGTTGSCRTPELRAATASLDEVLCTRRDSVA